MLCLVNCFLIFSNCSLIGFLNEDYDSFRDKKTRIKGYFEAPEGKFYIKTKDSLTQILYGNIDSIVFDSNCYYISSSSQGIVKSNTSIGIFRTVDGKVKLNRKFSQLKTQLFDQYRVIKEDSTIGHKKRYFTFLKGKKLTETSDNYFSNLLFSFTEITDSYTFIIFIIRVNFPDPENSVFEKQSNYFRNDAERILNGLCVEN